MQYIPSGSDSSSPEYKRNITNKGVDMRLSTDDIESVEIVEEFLLRNMEILYQRFGEY